MALNDAREKLAQAEDYLMQYKPESQEFEAALEHVLWTFKNTSLRDACKAVVYRVAKARSDESRVIKKLIREHKW